MPGPAFEYIRGAVHLPGARLWLDAHDPIGPAETVFVSHAHSDHTAAHARVLFSAPTQRLMRARVSGDREERVLDFGRPHDGEALGIGARRLTLLPAGHIFGSAMSLIEDESGSLLYTGDFKLRRGLSSEPCEPRAADVLVMETTYGRPEYVFPPTEEVIQGIVRFCHEALDQEEIPVLLGYSLGKSQEILRGLAGAGLRIQLSEAVAELTRIYASFGMEFPEYSLFRPETAAGHVVLAPPGSTSATLRRQLGRVRVAVLTGWAVMPGCHYQYQADAAFPLSDHADFPDLVEFVRRVAPRRVYTLHGFASDFAGHLRRLGVDARALGVEEQLELAVAGWSPTRGVPPPRACGPMPVPVPAPEAGTLGRLNPTEATSAEVAPGSFLAFAQTCAQVGAVVSKLEKQALLAAYLASIDLERLASVVTWFTGLVFPSPANRSLQLGWAVIRDAVCEITGLSPVEFRHVYLKHSDTGATVEELITIHAGRPKRQDVQGLALDEVQELFESLESACGPTEKCPLLASALRRCSPVEARFLVKVVTGNLRIGLKEGLVEEAVARAFGVTVDAIREVHACTGDLGATALLARRNQLASAGIEPFRPVRVMLASPESDAGAILDRVREWSGGKPGECGAGTVAWMEDKYDGIRCQVHKVGSRVMMYSRDLKEVTTQFAELARAAAGMPGDWILDGEVVAMDGGRVLPFQELQRRLGRREGDLFLEREVPICFIAFDVLWAGGEDVVRQPLCRRREVLDALSLPPGMIRARRAVAVKREEIEAQFAAARGRGNEGLVIKDPESAYTPGRRGISWLKLKRPGATLDCVVVGAEFGHGKRHAVLSDYTFAVRDEVGGGLKTIGKAYTGLTQDEIARLTGHFLGRVVRQVGRYHEVAPDVVLEIAFDSLQPSPRHSSGLAMRFPRIVRIRDDKTVDDIDTLATARRLASRKTEGDGRTKG